MATVDCDSARCGDVDDDGHLFRAGPRIADAAFSDAARAGAAAGGCTASRRCGSGRA